MVEEVFEAEESRKDPSCHPPSPYTSWGNQKLTLDLGVIGVFTHAWQGLDLGLPNVSSPKCTPAPTVLRKALDTVDRAWVGSWIFLVLGLTLGPVIPAGLAQVRESLVCVYLGFRLNVLRVPGVTCQRPLGVFQEQ